LNRRDEEVTYKGKGILTTYWCEPVARTEDISAASSEDMSAASSEEEDYGNTITI
jgi:hypothetical protein